MIGLKQCIKYVHAWRHLLYFATLKPSYPTSLTARIEGYGTQVGDQFIETEITIWNSLLRESGKEVYDPRFVFWFKDVEGFFGEFFKNWFAYLVKYDEALSCFFSTIFQQLPLTVELLSLTQAFDAYHGTKFSSHNNQTFERKVREIADTHKTSLSGIIDDPADFAIDVLHNRNYYTHHNSKWKKDGRVLQKSALFRLNEKLRLLFQTCVLMDMGVPAHRLPRLRFALASRIVDYE